MTELSDPRPDTSDMAPVHQVFRSSFGSAPAYVASTCGDTARRDLVADYYGNVLAFLEVHHEGEEKLVFPILRQRAPGCGALIDKMAEQHVEAMALLDGAKAAVEVWRGAPADSVDRSAEEAAHALTVLGDALRLHLDEEEADIVPLAADYLSVEEWGALPGHGMANFTGDKVWLILGLIRENFSAAQRQAMLGAMPPPARAMWETVGESAYASLIAQVRQAP
ncbi:MAG TPA: hemerythrin domain-containing protein [Acidimicrobiales bacterium]|nr:hemerythrin domain-containing protein [Acidimicrobiales bacterium]